MNAVEAAWRLLFQQSPIILNNGIAQNMPGGILPIMALTQAANFAEGLLSGGDVTNLDNFFANFVPVPGGTLIDQQIGKYPFANQAVAANATIQQPLRISFMMICPAQLELGYLTKLAVITALQSALYQHNTSGGTYTLATPFFFYTNCVMLSMEDASVTSSQQPQNTFRLNFEKPLITLSDAQAAQGSMLSKVTQGLPTNAIWSGISPTINQPLSLAGGALVPSVANSGASTIAAPTGPPL